MADSIHTGEAEDSSNDHKPKNKWSAYMFDMYKSRLPPVLGTVDVQKIEDLAREKLERMGKLGVL